jgi:hypothetical protein
MANCYQRCLRRTTGISSQQGKILTTASYAAWTMDRHETPGSTPMEPLCLRYHRNALHSTTQRIQMPRQDNSNISTTKIPSRILFRTPHAYYCGDSNTSIVHTRQTQPRHQHNTRPTIHTRCRNRPSPTRPRHTPRTNTTARTMASSITRLCRVHPS